MHLLVILGIALLVFGPRKLPELGKGLGEAFRGFRDGIHGTGENLIEPGETKKALPPASK